MRSYVHGGGDSWATRLIRIVRARFATQAVELKRRTGIVHLRSIRPVEDIDRRHRAGFAGIQ